MIFCNEYRGNFATRNHLFFRASNEKISQRVTSDFLQRATSIAKNEWFYSEKRATSEFPRETSNEWKFTTPLWRCLKNAIHQIDSKNKRLLISVIFTAKLELVFVLTFKNFFLEFSFKANRKSISSSKKRYLEFSK